jgi:hypothetical protein
MSRIRYFLAAPEVLEAAIGHLARTSETGRQYAFGPTPESCHLEFQHPHGGAFIELVLSAMKSLSIN